MGRAGQARARGPRIVAHTLSYPPTRRIGAELATHGLLDYLAGCGWRSLAVPHTIRGLRPARVDGVHVVPPDLAATTRADVVLAHVPFVQRAREMADRCGAPLVVAGHGGPPGWLAARAAEYSPDLLIANSQLMSVSLGRTGRPVHVLRPPVAWPDPWPCSTPDGMAVTLVNATLDKGAGVLRELAKRHPHLPFLVVRGGYGVQVDLSDLPNVTMLDHGTPMAQVWERTRLLLVPSVEESWGMVAVEAMARGIPVLGSMAAGLSECLGPDMPRIEIADLDAWSARLESAYDDPGWSDLHIAALRRAAELDPAADLAATRDLLERLIRGELAPVTAVTFRNLRTGDIASVIEGDPMYRRLSSLPLVWQPQNAEPGPASSAPAPGAVAIPQGPGSVPLSDPALQLPTAEQPARNAPLQAWIDYAVQRGADRRAAAAASKATLIALYGE